MIEHTRELLARIIEDSALVARVRRLDARTLGSVIRHVGLENAGELVALATADQVRDMFDDDLWTAPNPGEAEKFDGKRFGLWLEIMLESGEQFVANKLMELPEELVTLGFARLVYVLDADELAMQMSDNDDDCQLDKAMDNCLREDIDQYIVISRHHDYWDAAIAVLTALDQDNHSFLSGLLERLCNASSEHFEDNGGLYEVLTSDEMIEEDGTAERDERRATAGFVSQSDATAFLRLPTVMGFDDVVKTKKRDTISASYFRVMASTANQRIVADQTDDADAERFNELLINAGVAERPRPMLEAVGSENKPLFQQTMMSIREDEREKYEKRTEELTYLTNVLVSGGSYLGRSFRPAEAAEASICTCSIGMDYLQSKSSVSPKTILKNYDADHLFRIGWHMLFHNVAMKAAHSIERKCIEHSVPMRLLGSVRIAIDDMKPSIIRSKMAQITRHIEFDNREKHMYGCLLDICPVMQIPSSEEQDVQQTRFFASTNDIDTIAAMLESD